MRFGKGRRSITSGVKLRGALPLLSPISDIHYRPRVKVGASDAMAEMPVDAQRMQPLRLHRSQNEHPGVRTARARYANGHNQDVWITIGAVNGRPKRGVAIVLTAIVGARTAAAQGVPGFDNAVSDTQIRIGPDHIRMIGQVELKAVK